MAALLITGLVAALFTLPGWAAYEIVRRRTGLIRWSGLISLLVLPVTFYFWQYQEAIAHMPAPRDGLGFVDILFKALVGVWWLSTLIGFAAGVISRIQRRRHAPTASAPSR